MENGVKQVNNDQATPPTVLPPGPHLIRVHELNTHLIMNYWLAIGTVNYP